MRIYILLLLLLLLPGWIAASTHTVKLDGSGDYSSIQSAIIASTQGDSVLVYPGRYFENVDFMGKSITVCSLEATTSDSTYISSTIIDGNNSGSCVRFRNQEQGAVLRGFSLEHGTGSLYGAQNEFAGGGIHVYTNCSVSIMNCDIRYNRSSEGGGVFVARSSIYLSGVKIHDNYSTTVGAGLYIYSGQSYIPTIIFDPINRCSIYNNFSGNPCDIVVIETRANIDMYFDMVSAANMSSFYYARVASFQQSQGFHDNIYYLRVYQEEINHDLFVSPSGNDNNSGLNPEDALRSITKAVHRIASDSLNVKTVHVLPGTYCEGDDDQIFPIPGKSYVKIIGAGSEACTLFTNKTYSYTIQSIYLSSRQTNTTFSGFTIDIPPDSNRRMKPISCFNYDSELSDLCIANTNVCLFGVLDILQPNNAVLKNIRIRNIVTDQSVVSGYRFNGSMTDCVFENISSTLTTPDGWASSMFSMSVKDSLRIENCVFRNFSVPDLQPTMQISNANQNQEPISINISNSLFDNIHSEGESAVGFNNREVDGFHVNNCTFVSNHGAISAVGLTGQINMKNNIFYNPESEHEIQLYLSEPYGIDSNVHLDYNIILGGQSSVYNPYGNNHVIYGDTNISSEPGFQSLEPGNPLYATLSETSPCIDTGTPDITGLDLLPYDLAWNWRVWNGRIDMGCYEFDSEPWVSNDDPVVPVPNEVMSIYPNPFRGFANIRVELDDAMQNARLEVYNLRGQKVKIITLDASGKGQSWWDGRDDSGTLCANGVYVLSLSQGNKVIESKRVTLLK